MLVLVILRGCLGVIFLNTCMSLSPFGYSGHSVMTVNPFASGSSLKTTPKRPCAKSPKQAKHLKYTYFLPFQSVSSMARYKGFRGAVRYAESCTFFVPFHNYNGANFHYRPQRLSPAPRPPDVHPLPDPGVGEGVSLQPLPDKTQEN